MIKKEVEIFGLLFLGDGATIPRFTLLNILASAKNIPVAVLEIIDFQGHLARGNKKDATFICNIFLNNTREMLRLFYCRQLDEPDNQNFPKHQLVFFQKPLYSTMDIFKFWHHLLIITTQIFLLLFDYC